MRIPAWHLKIIFFCVLQMTVSARRGRFKSEVGLMHCLCGTPTPYRLHRIQCMEQFVPPGHMYTMSQSVQYCGYFASKTNFGQTVRQRIYISDYNPWQPTPDLYTDVTCGYTKIRPGNAAAPSIYYVTSKGWVISKCILNMAFIDPVQASVMLMTCCQ